MIVLSKFKNIQKLNHEITVKLDKKNLNLEGSTLIASDKYLYRGFGRYRNS